MISEPILVLLMVAAAGSVLASLSVRGVRMNTLGFLLAGILAGWFGLRLPGLLLDLGLALFVYSVGLQSGPAFFEAFRQDGLRLLGLAAAATAAVAAVVAGLGSLLGLRPAAILGTLCGTYNSPLALAAVQDKMPTPALEVAFGLVFPLSLVVMVLASHGLPRLLGVSREEALREHRARNLARNPKVLTRYFKVTNPACDGHSLAELHLGSMTGAVIATVESKGTEAPATAGRVLHVGDVVKAVGTREALDRCRVALGQEETGRRKRPRRQVVLRRVMVTKRDVVGKQLQELGLEERFDAVVTKIRRSGVTLTPRASTILYYGDKLEVVVRKENADELVAFLGNDIQGFYRTELAPAFLAMAAGALVGKLAIPLPGGSSVRLGLAGGVLGVGLVAGRLGRIGPVIFTMPAEGALVLRRLGSLLLMVTVGVLAGQGLRTSGAPVGHWPLVLSLLGSTAGLGAALAVTRHALGADTVETVGYVTGSLANTPSMEAGCSALGDDGPAATYALVYPIALVLQLLAAQVLVTFL